MSESYFTILSPATHEIKIRGSRFIGWLYPVVSKEDAIHLLEKVRKQYHDATHHCYAYRLKTMPPYDFRFSDDGEPSGTAGRPILDVLEGHHLTQIICLVTRYFGGTKLGPGGLARAYSQCASEVLDLTTRIKKYHTVSIRIRFDFSQTGVVMPLLSQFKVNIIDTQYHNQTELSLQVRSGLAETLKKTLTDRTSGKIIIKAMKPAIYYKKSS